MGPNAGSSFSAGEGETRRLLIRPQIKPGEWWDAYVVRTLNANGVRTSQCVVGQADAQGVAEMAGGLVAKEHGAGENIDATRRRYGHTLLPRWAVRGHASSISRCPQCFEEDGLIIPMSWRLRRLTCCVRHRTRLQAACPACGKGLLLREIFLGRCRCGIDVSAQTRSEVALNHEVCLHAALGLATAHGSGSIADGGGLSQIQIALFAFSTEVLTTIARSRNRASDGSVIAPTQVAQDLGVIPRHAPAWLEDLWSSLRTKLELNQALSFVARLHHEEQSATTAMSRLPLLNWMQQLVDLGASTGSAESNGWLPNGCIKPKHVFLTRASTVVGIDTERLITLVKHGQIEPTRRLASDRREMLFALEDLARLSSKRLIEFGRSLGLGLSAESIRHLKSSGAVSVVRDWRGFRWLNVDELQLLLDDLSKVARPLKGQSMQLINLASDAVWRHRHVPVLKEFLSLLRRGELPLWSATSGEGFSGYYIDPLSLATLVRSRRISVPHDEDLRHQIELGLHGGSPAYDCAGISCERRQRVRKPRRRPPAPGQLALPGFYQ